MIAALAAVAAGCIIYGMLRENHPVFVIGLAFAVPAYLLFRKRYKEQIREKYGEVKASQTEQNKPGGSAGDVEG
jgi:hypothetical protein